jgi:hypothetical protein
MIHRRDKDLAWLITFASFLVFLLSAIIAETLKVLPKSIPAPITLANASLGRSFVFTLANSIRYTSLAIMVYGMYGILRWPPGSHD